MFLKNNWMWSLGIAGCAMVVALSVGCNNSFEKRFNDKLIGELRRMTEKQKAETDEMSILRLCQSQAQVSQQILDKAESLDNDALSEVLYHYTNALLLMMRQGDSTSGEKLINLCRDFSTNEDPRIREQCELALSALEFQRHIEELKLANNINEIALLCSRAEAGEDGAKVVALAEQFKNLVAEQNTGTDRSQEINEVLDSMGKLIVVPTDRRGQPTRKSTIPPWVGDLQEIEKNYNKLAAANRESQLTRSGKLESIMEQIKKLIKSYPHSANVAAAVNQFADMLINVGQFEAAQELRQIAVESLAADSNADVAGFVKSFNEQSLVAELKLDRYLHDWWKNPDLAETESIEDLKTQVQKAKADGLMSELLVTNLLRLASVLERSNQIEKARDFLAFLVQQVGSESPFEKEISTYASAANKRLDLVGKPFHFPTAEMAEPAIDPASFEGAWIAVVFWKNSDRASFGALESFNAFELNPKYKENKITAIGISVDPNLEGSHDTVKLFNYDWPLLVAKKLTDDGQNPFAVEYGIDTAPYCLLVNREGMVERIGSSPQELVSRAWAESASK